MKLEEKYQTVEEQLEFEAKKKSNTWKWIRRCIVSVAVLTLVTQCLPTTPEPILSITRETQPKRKTVLQTGFPPVEKVTGYTITLGQSAATAFSPNPPQADLQVMGESWWDRMFPNRHVHLLNVQIPVVQGNQSWAEGILSICESKKQKFGLSPSIPDLNHCVETAAVKASVEEGDAFAVLEWTPESPIVLKKSKLYWLVVQTTAEPLVWVYAQEGANPYGTAFQTELGWEFKLEGEAIPSAMVVVQDHA